MGSPLFKLSLDKYLTSVISCIFFWEPVYYKVDENESVHRFLSQSNEKRGHWVGFADNKGDHLTWKILIDETQQIITRSAVTSANKTSPNFRLVHQKGWINHKILHLKCLFMVGFILMDLKNILMSTINFVDFGVEDFFASYG